MKQNIIISLLSIICAILGYIAAQINQIPSQQKTDIAVPLKQPNQSNQRADTPAIPTQSNQSSNDWIDGGTISRPAPEYPSQSAEYGEEGTVQIEIRVETNGTVSSAKVAKSSGHSRLDNAALRAFKNDTYTPINKMRTKYIVKTQFTLD